MPLNPRLLGEKIKSLTKALEPWSKFAKTLLPIVALLSLASIVLNWLTDKLIKLLEVETLLQIVLVVTLLLFFHLIKPLLELEPIEIKKWFMFAIGSAIGVALSVCLTNIAVDELQLLYSTATEERSQLQTASTWTFLFGSISLTAAWIYGMLLPFVVRSVAFDAMFEMLTSVDGEEAEWQAHASVDRQED